MAQTHSSKPGAPKRVRRSTGTFHVYRPKAGAGGDVLPEDVVVIPESAAADVAIRQTGHYVQVTSQVAARIRAARRKRSVKAVINAEAFKPDARARAVLRGIAYAQEDLETSGGAYDIDEVRTLLHGVTRQAVDKRIADGSLIAVPGPSGRRRFPTVQFNDDGSIVSGLKEVQAALGYSNPWSVLNFLVNESDALHGARPIDVLRRGDGEAVVRAARNVGVQGA